jgi:hypothetical protein
MIEISFYSLTTCNRYQLAFGIHYNSVINIEAINVEVYSLFFHK